MAGCQYIIAQGAYIKIVLHALKHRSSAVNGLLVGRLIDGGSAGAAATVQISDAVPFSHSHIGILTYLELALIQVEEHFGADGLAVVGYYHANERHDDCELGSAARKIGDHIFRYFPQAALILLDNKKLKGLAKGTGRDLVLELFTRDSSRSWRHASSEGSSQLSIKEPSANVVLLDYISTEKWNLVVDFDDHLDDISKDWLNPNLFN